MLLRTTRVRRFRPGAAVAVAIGVVVAALLGAGASSTTRSGRSSSPDSALPCVWRTAATEDPHRHLYDRFNSVAVVSSRDAWAVGDYYTGRKGGPNGAFIERWNGRRWRLVGAPNLRGATLWSVSASAPHDVWAVGQADLGRQLVEHWDGKRWRAVVPAPHTGGILNAVAARSRDDAWAVGARSLGAGGKTLIEHWNGGSWSVVPSPNPTVPHARRPYAVLRAVAALSPTNTWAVGYSGGVRSAVTKTLIEHWDGRRWMVVPSPNVASAGGVTNDLLFSVSGSRPNDVWAVGSWGTEPGGYGGKGDHALVLHWNGRRWSRVASPAIGRRSLLSGIAARAGRAWAVGDRGLQPRQRTLIERFDGTRWSIVPSPPGFSLNAVSALSGGPAWAVGANGRRPLATHC